jgi:uncharacterized protein
MAFEWDPRKNAENILKHDVDFQQAIYAFHDKGRVVLSDRKHSSEKERRYFLLGLVGGRVLTVRFTMRYGNVRIFGAGYWRMGKELYEKAKRGRI